MEARQPETPDPAALIAAAPKNGFALIELRLDWPRDLEIHPKHRQLWVRLWRAVDRAATRINKLPEPSFAPQPPRIVGATPARSDPCPCGSAKRCHGA